MSEMVMTVLWSHPRGVPAPAGIELSSRRRCRPPRGRVASSWVVSPAPGSCRLSLQQPETSDLLPGLVLVRIVFLVVVCRRFSVWFRPRLRILALVPVRHFTWSVYQLVPHSRLSAVQQG